MTAAAAHVFITPARRRGNGRARPVSPIFWRRRCVPCAFVRVSARLQARGRQRVAHPPAKGENSTGCLAVHSASGTAAPLLIRRRNTQRQRGLPRPEGGWTRRDRRIYYVICYSHVRRVVAANRLLLRVSFATDTASGSPAAELCFRIPTRNTNPSVQSDKSFPFNKKKHLKYRWFWKSILHGHYRFRTKYNRLTLNFSPL